jgi:hypothetical protein
LPLSFRLGNAIMTADRIISLIFVIPGALFFAGFRLNP